MLKRQRPVTPPPLLDEIPSLMPFPDRPIRPIPHHETPPDMFPHGSLAKRRRIHPPVLDGAQRGWGKPPPLFMPHTDDSDGEEDWIDGENDAESGHFSESPDYTEYRQANTMLHEMHALHQHRLMFIQPNSQPPSHLYLPPHADFSASPPPMATHPHNLWQSTHGIRHSPSISSNGKLFIPTLPECPLPEFYSHLPHAAQTHTEPAAQAPLDFHEVKSVRERYEDTNKLLGSVFLSRRRELQEGPHSSTPVMERGHSD
ncbi:uncharacterized protein EDB93DRAFT_1244825 [Suillus bovinus]|uniref:uncharacterized protein n=1 Tax=Suillus bovinus TaxID=48563 RepID=UPI001B86746B|nr:uncharacterized protein EDB93DRAFT_1244825 [Suillus bovinus]KAG2160076.1 hypothetical protein EDB93DRAFT_1244825 [Suillus bovinus]